MKSVVMVGGGIQQVEAVNVAKKLGFFVIVTDRNKNAPCFENADLGVVLDGKDVKGISEFIKKNRQRYNIRGVFTCVNLASTVARVAKSSGLLGVLPKAAELGDNKLKQKRALQKNNIPTSKFLNAKSVSVAIRAYKKLGPKVVVKPVDSFGGQGVKIVENEIELKKSFNKAKIISRNGIVIIEEFLEGHFVDLEGIFYGGKFIPIAILDSYFITEHPKGNRISPIEYKNIYPSTVNKKMKNDLFKITEMAARAIGIDFGPVGTDMVITKRGPMIIEISARLHGSSANLYLIPKASGIEPVKLLVQVVTGGKISKSDVLPKFSKIGVYKYILSKQGQIRKIIGFDSANEIPGIVKTFLFKNPGDEIFFKNSTDVPASLAAVAENVDRAEDAIRKAEAMIKFDISSS
jgi:biotin carboxylase